MRKFICAGLTGNQNFQGYTLIFIFESNEYFENTELKKWYRIKFEPDEKDTFSYDGPTTVFIKGCLLAVIICAKFKVQFLFANDMLIVPFKHQL